MAIRAAILNAINSKRARDAMQMTVIAMDKELAFQAESVAVSSEGKRPLK